MDAHIDTREGALQASSGASRGSARAALLALPLAQFVCSYAASNMNVAVSSIARDLGTDVHAVQIAISLFTLTMAALMIPGSKLTDIWGRKFCFLLGLVIYGVGALIATVAPGIGILIIGYSLFEGIGSALLIPPIYILVTVLFRDVTSRARSFGIVSAAAGIGAAAGPLIGGIITSAISWRASFLLQVLIVFAIIILGRGITDPGIEGTPPRLDIVGAVLSAAGLFFIVLGILASGAYGWFTSKQDFTIGSLVVIPKGGISPVWVFVAIGALLLVWFFLHLRSREREGKAPLVATRLFRNRTSNLGLTTQLVQWLVMQGSFFVISVFLQTVRGFSAIQTGLSLVPAIIGILLTSSFAGRMAGRRSQKNLIVAGFIISTAGLLLVIFLGRGTTNVLALVPGLFLMGVGIGVMLTMSVNVVQSAFPERDQGEISGLSRSVSNLGSSLGTSLVGSVLVVDLLEGNKDYALALIVMVVFSCIGLIAALLLPAMPRPTEAAGTTEVRQQAAT